VAGESPDRSERERSSGETADGTGSVPAKRQDPREAYAADAASADRTTEEDTSGEEVGDANDAGDANAPADARDARLRAAVAAWVSGTEGESAEGKAEGEDGPDEDAPTPGSGAGGELPVRPRGAATEPAPAEDSSKEQAASSDTATTMFGVRPESVEPTDKGSAAARAERMTSAFFGSSRKSGEKAGEASEAPEDAAEAETEDEPGDRQTGPDDAPTAAAEAAAEAEAFDERREADEAGVADEGEVSGETADADRDAAAEADSGEGDDAPGDDAPAGDGPAGEEPKDRATTAFRAVPPESAPEAPEAPEARESPEPPERQDHPTTAIRLPKEKRDDRDDGEGGEGGDSRFVPLRSTDEARTPAVRQPLPDAETTGTKTPTGTITGVGGEQESTKQQPLPEPPPLELLAQLTNTPPPPETPLRTAVRRVKIWTPLAALLALVFVIAQAARPLPEPTLTLTAQETYTFDGGKPSLPWPGEGQAYVEVSGLGVLGSSGEQKPVPIGSVAKTMTAYLVLQKEPLKEGEPGPMITVDQKAEDGGKRGAGNGNESVLPSVEKGDKISERDALSALMIPSANNIARLLGRWHSGSEAAFVDEMNETAKELGMENTTYTDPSGLKETTVSTAADQVKLGKKVMEFPGLVEITKMPWWKDPFSGKRMRNYNSLVPFNGAIGIKTGTTTAAGGNLLFAGHKDVGGTRQLIVGAVLGQHKPPIIDTVNAVSRQLLDTAGEALTSEKIVEKGDVVGYLDDGLGGRTPVVATRDVEAVGYGGVEVDLALETKDDVPHAAPAGKKVGTLTVGGGPGQVEVPVALQKHLTEPGFGDKLTRIL
jgi:serine-type D-Ala-D-Ala carboxypeptidase (penicillin-binding protein 5/6)